MSAPDPTAIARAYRPAADLLRERVVLVTGAGQGLGRAVALAAAQHGATVALLGRKVEKLERTYDAITKEGWPEPALIPLDLATASDTDFENLRHVVGRELGRLDGVVHCAAEFVPLGPLADQGLEPWMKMLRVNLAAPFALTRAVLPLLADSPHGSVVFTGETHGEAPRAYWGGFAVAKAALSTLATIWADELEHAGGAKINVIVPGPIDSPQRAQSHPGEDRSRLPRPEALACAYLYLLGPESPGISGRTLVL